LIEDNSIKVDNEDVEDSLRIICNNTGKSNFIQKVEDLKKYVIPKPPTVGVDGTEIIDEKSLKAEDNLRWFIQYILAKRLGAQSITLQVIYIEMLRELHTALISFDPSRSVVRQVMFQTALIFKKCMLIDEDEFSQCSNNGPSILKSYVASLGSFIGSMTLARNEPIRTSHLDLKQILVEGWQVKSRKLAIIFVCRVLKESQHSRVFNLRNPYICTMLQILKEIQQFG
jgi:CCR4-NOT transcription complex subunit 1